LLLPLLQREGGLQGLLQKFDGAGLGDVAKSWIGKGENLPVSASQLTQLFGGADGLLGAVSQQTGMPAEAAAGELARTLPGLVDSLTPDGAIPSGDLASLAKSALGSGALGKLFG
jgi:uncharacterized protein YidB (DUF937 family)